jgi:CelD/BcsL family acetyltransferase involved in cellulose biosynthesis
MKLRIVRAPQDFADLRPAWDRLHQRCGQRSLFLSHAWLDAAWQWQPPSARLCVLCCEREGELIGALPLLRTDGRSLKFISVPDTQQCDVLAARDDAASVVEAFADELTRERKDWDALRLRYLRDDAVAVRMFATALRQRGAQVDVRSVTSNPRVALNATWEAYYGSRSRRLKKAANLAANRLAKAGAVDIHWLAPGQGDRAEVDRELDHVIRVSARSWKRETGNSLDQAGPQAFIRRLSHHAHDQGWLSIWRLSLDGVPIAMEYQLVGDGNVYALRSDFDADHEALSPGSHLSRHILETLFAQGLRHYSMGPGDNAYKHRWADDVEPVLALTAYSSSLRGRALAAWELAVKPAARRVRDGLRPRPPAPAEEHDEVAADSPRRAR